MKDNIFFYSFVWCYKCLCLKYGCTCSIGRVTGRLPQELADEVVESLLELFRHFSLSSPILSENIVKDIDHSVFG